VAVNIEVEVFWVVTLCRIVVGYRRFRGLCHLHLQVEVTGDGLVFFAFLFPLPITSP
jgi:hypothetical protein